MLLLKFILKEIKRNKNLINKMTFQKCRNCSEKYDDQEEGRCWSAYACECFSGITCMNCKIFNHFCDERICLSCIRIWINK